MFKKIIFLVFKNNYRFNALGNFAKTSKYEDILLISLGGRFKSFIGKILYFFRLGKFISIDGDPILNDEKLSINFWFTGTSLKISKNSKHLKNNFVNMSNPVIGDEKKIFQLYPIVKKNFNMNQKPKIIFMGKLFFKPGNSNLINSEILMKIRGDIINNFSLIDDYKFWNKMNNPKDSMLKFENYKILKTYLREQIILGVKKKFENSFSIYGEDNKQIGIDFSKPIYDKKKIKEIYKGNICIDTGSILGSLSLHPRSIQIIESGGLLLQAKQHDSDSIWGDLSERVVSDNLNSLIDKLEKYLLDKKMCDETLNMIFEKFKDSKKKIGVNLKKSLFN